MSKQKKSKRKKRLPFLKEGGDYELKVIDTWFQRTPRGKPIDGFSLRAEVESGDQKGKIVDLAIFNCNSKDSDQVSQIKERVKFFTLRALRAETSWMIWKGKGKILKATLRKFKNFLTIQNYQIEPVFESGEKEVNVCDFDEHIINPRSSRFKGWDFGKIKMNEFEDRDYSEIGNEEFRMDEEFRVDEEFRTDEVFRTNEFEIGFPRRTVASEYTSESMDGSQYVDFVRRSRF